MTEEEAAIKALKDFHTRQGWKDIRPYECYWNVLTQRFIIHVAGTKAQEVGSISKDDIDFRRNLNGNST